jgi:hypothetical protein
MELAVETEVQVRFGQFGDNANLMQYTCTVCA